MEGLNDLSCEQIVQVMNRPAEVNAFNKTRAFVTIMLHSQTDKRVMCVIY